ncbi:unnamed protein product [Cyprideis torosa]|uniref:Protein Wnt n=1 Tax=Cyprideis torosa TaxID=163714 RepID=A0A7R8W1Z6_9CRUS|nr:unnamed protein product [Cyprideis torosa]CAG0881464.1 unnamed protein product [Cyprideis torosa]
MASHKTRVSPWLPYPFRWPFLLDVSVSVALPLDGIIGMKELLDKDFVQASTALSKISSLGASHPSPAALRSPQDSPTLISTRSVGSPMDPLGFPTDPQLPSPFPGNNELTTNQFDCRKLRGSLVKNQIRFCEKHPGFMYSVVDGARDAMSECQYQFRNWRWNCSTLENDAILESIQQALSDSSSRTRSSSGTRLEVDHRGTRGLQQGTRELAYVHAIGAAGVAHAVTRACSNGLLAECGCDKSVPDFMPGAGPEFQWSGCSDNIGYAIVLSRRFVDAKEQRQVRNWFSFRLSAPRKDRLSFKLFASRQENAQIELQAFWFKTRQCTGQDNAQNRRRMAKRRDGKDISPAGIARTLMNLHNNEAGRQVLSQNMRVSCKCHGVSGSCNLKTCWRHVPSFREVGELLKEKFDTAYEVQHQIEDGNVILVPRSNQFKPHTREDLIYMQPSPSYCEFDVQRGSLGTQGRECNQTSDGIDGCDLLCCGRGYRTERQTRMERCNCKFKWCCEVKCEQCEVTVERHICL